jgi:hypothetical protein
MFGQFLTFSFGMEALKPEHFDQMRQYDVPVRCDDIIMIRSTVYRYKSITIATYFTIALANNDLALYEVLGYK